LRWFGLLLETKLLKRRAMSTRHLLSHLVKIKANDRGMCQWYSRVALSCSAACRTSLWIGKTDRQLRIEVRHEAVSTINSFVR
jgi:hypothetical protein